MREGAPTISVEHPDVELIVPKVIQESLFYIVACTVERRCSTVEPIAH